MDKSEIALPTSRQLSAEHLMVDGGYASVSTRRVTSQASIKPALVHYYFKTTDNLFLGVFDRAAMKRRVRIGKELASDAPLHALWKLASDLRLSALMAEFNAAANHRKVNRAGFAGGIGL
ncbi:TetR/AcrR family transcriptional regulator [Novosphingobium sp. G106]|uniref:TetR/AcrR family transcriptional regulator n=1 Tax=Novosphingobium sp. G106 TaxID=2849500 RepID=UPI001C2D11EB|nr:TetR family transcriptional regulator [Novosphingobium sp. G106]MBV1691833.1 TetR/AcrR family transcriptional regulator [Novosphingobium sp. G106]MBV1692148.1 TetR/AcrR family transcriptional regulator [Novosphingobium sp. G106]